MPEQIELIDKKALIKDIADGIRLADEWEKESYEKKDECGLKHAVATRQSLLAMIERVKEAPTIEAEPVRHAYWEPSDVGEYHCTNCGVECDIDKFHKALLNTFCGYCGARMDGGFENGGTD